MGRAARHINGRAVLYAERETDSMKQAIGETNRRRVVQKQYNEANNITPASILKPIDMSLARVVEADYLSIPIEEDEIEPPSSPEEMAKLVERLENQMREAAQKFEFEKAATLRDRVKSLRTGELFGPHASWLATPLAEFLAKDRSATKSALGHIPQRRLAPPVRLTLRRLNFASRRSKRVEERPRRGAGESSHMPRCPSRGSSPDHYLNVETNQVV